MRLIGDNSLHTYIHFLIIFHFLFTLQAILVHFLNSLSKFLDFPEIIFFNLFLLLNNFVTILNKMRSFVQFLSLLITLLCLEQKFLVEILELLDSPGFLLRL